MAQYDIDIRDYWRIIKKRKTIIIFSMVTMLVFSFIFGKYMETKQIDYYASSATIRIDTQPSADKLMMSSYGFPESDDISAEVKTITSFPVMAEIALRLEMLPDSLHEKTEEVRNDIVQSDPLLLSIVNSLTSYVNPEQFEFTNIVVVNTVALDPSEARDMAKHSVEAYKDIRRKRANQQTVNTINFIKNQIVEVLAESDSVQKVIESFSSKDESLEYYSGDVISGDMVGLVRRNNTLDLKIFSSTRVLSRLEKDGVIDDSVLSNAFAETEGSIFREKYAELQRFYAQRDEFQQYFTDEHPQIKNITVKIENNKKFLVSQLKNNLMNLELQKESNNEKITNLKDQYRQILDKNGKLKRHAEKKFMLDEQYIEYIKELQLVEIKGAENIDEVTIIEPAVRNPMPINASRSAFTISFIGLFLGMVIGFVGAFIAESMDTSIGTMEDVEEYIGVPVIGMIPHIEPDKLKSEKESSYSIPDEKELSKGLQGNDIMLVIHYAPKGVLAESYRSLRTNIQFISHKQEASVLLFTSSSQGEGKTTTIVNMALTMAQSGKHVLLIDADMRGPSLNRIFGLSREVGLSEIILGKRYWRECIKTVADIITGELGMSDIILEPGIDNLHIITCGPIPPNPSELLNSDKTDEFISEVRKEYDIVLFDCTPTLPATDSAVLSRKIDGVVFVYAVGKVSRGSLKRAKIQLDNVNARIIGVVLNGIRSDMSSDFQDYKYQEYSYAYEEEEEVENSIEKVKKLMSSIINRFV
ncbi:MAG: AAA family ATPase [Candidatus Latescibacteria bacterium]|nr:AAA family ATPase [Candidatus Latescibacterota bacterium]